VFRRFEHPGRPRLSGGVVFGLILIVMGAALLLDNLGVIYVEDALNLWPCALIALGLLRLWNCGFFSVWGQLLVAGGALCLIGVAWNEAAMEVWWPILVVWVGLFVAIRAFLPSGRTARGFPRRWRGRRRCDGMGAASVTIGSESEEHPQ